MELLNALGYVLGSSALLWLILGVGSGIFVGAVPGLGGGMLIALVMPLTFYMNSTVALVMMIGMYVGSVSGGLISATLLRMPGTPSSIMTIFDGYPMAQRGEAGRALGLSIGSSLVGGVIAGIFLVLLSPPLSIWALTFGPWEYFSMVLMALVLIASIAQGSMIKGLLAGTLGVISALPGLSASDGQLRLTFGFHAVDGGFSLLPVLLGVFVVSQIVEDTININRKPVVSDNARLVFPSIQGMAGVFTQYGALRLRRDLDRNPARGGRQYFVHGGLRPGQDLFQNPGQIRHRP